MLSSAEKVKGHGVSSAYIEQVNLVKRGLKIDYDIYVNKFCLSDIMHYHTIDIKHYLMSYFAKYNGVNVGYVHFLPETIKESLKLPDLAQVVLDKYIISFYKKMDHLVIVNPCFIERLVAYGIKEDKITYIPNFVSEKYFFPILDNNKRMRLREEYKIPKDSFVVLGVGQVQTRKGIVDFVNTAQKCKDVTFIWAGGFSFGKITSGYNELKQIVDNPPSNVKFYGILKREQMRELYNASDLLFLPSFHELFPMTILEAFNCGLPVLLRDLDNYPQIFFDFYIKGKDHNDFKEEIEKLRKEKEYLKYWKCQAWKGHEYYSEENVLRMWEAFYRRISNEKKQ